MTAWKLKGAFGIPLFFALLATAKAQDFTYITNSDGAITITAYTGPGGVVVTIPDTINGLPVTVLGDRAFYGYSTPGVVIPNTVTNIGNFTFWSCNLTNITLPNSILTVGKEAFGAAIFNSIAFPDSVISIGVNVFDSSYNLTNVTFGTGLKVIGDDAFYYVDNLPSITIPDNVVSLGKEVFYGCYGLHTVNIGNGVTNIGPSEFYFCNTLTNVTIGTNVTSIGNNAFQNCSSLQNIIIPDAVQSIGVAPFIQCLKLTNVTIGKGLTNIPLNVFQSLPKLKSIQVDPLNPAFSSLDGVWFTKDGATLLFYPPAKVGNYYTIPDSVTNIATAALNLCLNLTEVVVGKSVATIGDKAFYTCPHLSAVFFEGNAPALGGSSVFSNDPATVYYLSGTTGWGPTYGGLPTALWNPQFTVNDSTFGIQNGQFGFTVTGTTNIPIVLEATPDLANPSWTPLQSCTLTNGSLYFADPNWTSFLRRFYRIRSP